MRVLKTIHLSDFQKKVLVVVHAAQTPQVAFEELRKQAAEDQGNINTARDMLEKLGLLEVGQDQVTVTPQGEQVMQDEYLIDEMGELTEEAQKYLEDASGNQDAEMQQPPPEQGDEMMGDELGMGNEMGAEENPFEGFDLFKLIHDQSKFLKN